MKAKMMNLVRKKFTAYGFLIEFDKPKPHIVTVAFLHSKVPVVKNKKSSQNKEILTSLIATSSLVFTFTPA